jgi:hypothetical protein
MFSRPFFFTIEYMGRGSGDEAAGTASALRALSEKEVNFMQEVRDLVDGGDKIILDSRLGNQKKDIWSDLAAFESIPYIEVYDSDNDLRAKLEEALKAPSLVVFHNKKNIASDIEEFIAALARKNEATGQTGEAYRKDPRSILFIDDQKGDYYKTPSWLKNKKAHLADEIIFHLTTEELGLLSSGERLTFSKGEQVFRIHASDLDCSVKELAEGSDARVGNVVLSYS